MNVMTAYVCVNPLLDHQSRATAGGLLRILCISEGDDVAQLLAVPVTPFCSRVSNLCRVPCFPPKAINLAVVNFLGAGEIIATRLG